MSQLPAPGHVSHAACPPPLRSVVRYNHMAHRLKLVPATAKRADGVTYELRINRDASMPQELANVDLKVRVGLHHVCVCVCWGICVCVGAYVCVCVFVLGHAYVHACGSSCSMSCGAMGALHALTTWQCRSPNAAAQGRGPCSAPQHR